MSMWLKVVCMFDWPCMERFASHAIVISHHVNAMPHNALRPGRHLQPLLSSPGRSCQTWPRHEEGPIGVRGPKGQMGEHFSWAGALFGGHYYSISGALLLYLYPCNNRLYDYFAQPATPKKWVETPGQIPAFLFHVQFLGSDNCSGDPVQWTLYFIRELLVSTTVDNTAIDKACKAATAAYNDWGKLVVDGTRNDANRETAGHILSMAQLEQIFYTFVLCWKGKITDGSWSADLWAYR